MATKKKAAAAKAKPPTKSEIISQIADKTGLTKKDVGAVFDELNMSIKRSLRKAGEFTMPGLVKMRVVKKPATKARPGVNPFTGEAITIRATKATYHVEIDLCLFIINSPFLPAILYSIRCITSLRPPGRAVSVSSCRRRPRRARLLSRCHHRPRDADVFRSPQAAARFLPRPRD